MVDRSQSRVHSYLKKCFTKDSERATHVSLDGGMWRVEDWDTFWDLMAEDILNGCLFPICELREEYGPFFLDFDAKVDVKLKKPEDFEHKLINIINKQIPKFFPDGICESLLETIVLSCSKRYAEGETKYKYGYHIHWPNLIVDQYSALLIRMSIIAGCRSFKKEEFFSEIVLEDAFDISPFRNCRGSLRMLGAPKPKYCPDCKNVPKQKKTCTTCLSCGFITPEPLTYKLDMVFKGTERSPELESKYKNTVQLLKKTCLRKGKTSITEGFVKYKECPEPDVFIHKPKKEPFLQDVGLSEEKNLPKSKNSIVVTETDKLQIIESMFPKFGSGSLNNPYTNMTIRKAVVSHQSGATKEKGKMCYTVNVQDEGSNFCPFKKCNHRGNHIYMKIFEGQCGHSYATLKCYDQECMGKETEKKHLNPQQHKCLFINIPNEKKRKIPVVFLKESTNEEDVDNFFSFMKHTRLKK